MAAYVTFDSLDAGRRWNQRTGSGIGHVGCIPSNTDRGLSRLDCLPPNNDAGLAQLEVFTAVARIGAAAITAGGAVGAAAITADASKYAVKQQTKTDLLIALGRQKADLEQAKIMAEASALAQKETTARTRITSEATTEQTQQVTSNLAPVVAVLGLAGLAALVLLKD